MVTSIIRHHSAQDDVSVTLKDEALTTLAEFAVANFEALSVHLTNNGNNLDQFEISGKVNEGGTYEILFNAAVDFTTVAGILIGASGDLTTLGSGNTGWFLIYPKGFHTIRIRAARATGSNTTVDVASGGS